jgi:hypothetical protein
MFIADVVMNDDDCIPIDQLKTERDNYQMCVSNVLSNMPGDFLITYSMPNTAWSLHDTLPPPPPGVEPFRDGCTLAMADMKKGGCVLYLQDLRAVTLWQSAISPPMSYHSISRATPH